MVPGTAQYELKLSIGQRQLSWLGQCYSFHSFEAHYMKRRRHAYLRWAASLAFLTAVLSHFWIAPPDAVADSGRSAGKHGVDHLDPGDLPTGVQRIHRSITERLGVSDRPLAEIVADIPGTKSWSLPHDEVLIQLPDGGYVLMTRAKADTSSISLDLLEQKIGERMIDYGSQIAPRPLTQRLNEFDIALSNGRSDEATRIYDALDGQPLAKDQIDFMRGSVERAARQARRTAKRSSHAKELADMSQALALRRALGFSELKETRYIPPDAVELWVPKDWTHIAQLPPSRLVPGKPLGTSRSFRAAIVDRANSVSFGSDAIQVNGVDYVRRRTVRRIGAVGAGAAAAIYVILRPSSLQDEQCDGTRRCD